MYYYYHDNNYLFSLSDEYNFNKISEEEALSNCCCLYYLIKIDKNKSKKTFAVSACSDLYIKEENIDILVLKETKETIPEKIRELIEHRKIKAVNTSYAGFEKCFFMEEPRKKRVNILALGDVGSTMLMGLKLLGGESIDSIGIFDRSEDKIKRWEYEMNQTSLPFDYDCFPEVHGIKKEELFDCDLFAFCASKGVPPVGSSVKDVRMVQFEENSKLIKEYAQMAAQKKFKGIFAVVSDPVDPLCKVVYEESNYMLNPEQIKGYGLGVMNARASYYAKKELKFSQFLTEGRAFGPHGNDLIIADSISNYNDELSSELTKLAVEANLEVRKTGFKPFIAPALSSGAISIIHTLAEKWHYSSNFIGGVYMGAKNRNTPAGVEIEKINMPQVLFDRIDRTYKALEQIR
ncbi:malate/lactate dehydrogenase [Sedimentibacter acidaminivorans]|uniref:Malate/lactate dehydrogenase n=1 Tax=Sedimentibacter acidaminivorans TaxID=913099 RepID=A0ABS4GEL9_9FIRM|nr:lactate dehydrogenase [Sedimentibacter acidaminivorans]MBP1926141.1 malate/lactate dehydrogenase [Sedimentibacter acidaminivorans]